ncbi:PT domain-containing protein [Brevibacterium yomogidense]|uniref:5'-nucleotidase n=1 Tax=Brevibacterium yomogidense TaxID=946573 RepID=A0A1X6WTR3_9MICO|nr:PT domain-containing protein [Brevibacterium yomogidense]SLM88359.1 5'-nucleotidase [Brevibacterium yomogidense]
MKKTSIRTRTLAPAVVLAVGALVATPAIATTTTDAEQTPDTAATPAPAAEAEQSTDTKTQEAETQEAAEASPAESSETADEGGAATQEPETTATEETTQGPAETEEAAVAPAVTFPNQPSGEVDRDSGESISIKVAYEGVQSLDPITVYVNGEKVEHGEGYEAIQQTDYFNGGFWLRLDGAFMDAAGSASDTVEVRVGEARGTIQVNEITEDPADISPSVEMDHPLQAADVSRDGIEVRIKTAPNAEVDVSKVSVMFDAGYTLSPEGDWNGTADENGDYTFTISPDTEITSGFNPDRNTTVGQLREGDSVIVQIRSNGKNSSHTASVEGEHPADISPSVEMDHPLQAADVSRDGIEVRIKTAPNAEVDVSKVSVMFDAGYTLSPEGDWNGTADENGDYTFTISPDTEITSTFDPSRNTTVGQLQDGDGVVVQISSNGKNTSFATEIEGEAGQPAEPTVEFPDHPDNAAKRTLGEDFTTTVAYTGATEGNEVRVIVNGNTQTHGEGTYEAPATVTETDGEFQVTLPADFLDEVHSGTADDQDVLQVRVGTTRNHIRITETEAAAEPTVEFPDYPDNAAERTIGGDFTATVAYTGATAGDEVRVIVNGTTQTHGEGTYDAPATVTETDGEFQITLPADFLDDVHSGTADDQDVLQVRVGTTRNHIRITEVESDPTEEPTEDPTDDPTSEPTEDPTDDPTGDPTDSPTEDPTDDPTDEPTEDPSGDPTDDGDDEQSAPALSIEPDRISMSDFVDPERGVTLTVTGLEPGDDIDFGVDPASGQNVDPATLPAVATEEGVASTVVYGVSSADAASYIGDFDVTVDGIDDAEARAGSEAASPTPAAADADAVGSFTVLSDEDADDEQDGDRDDDAGDEDDRDGEGDRGSDDDRDGEAGEDDGSGNGSDSDDDAKRDGGKDLPRTGGEFGGLAVGGALLAVGAAAVIVTRRRMNQG